MVDKAIYAEKEAERKKTARKVRPFAWAGLAVNIVAFALILNSFAVNIATVGARSESFIATTVTMFTMLVALAMLLGWGRWLYKGGTTDGMSVLWITTILLLLVAISPAMDADFYYIDLSE